MGKIKPKDLRFLDSALMNTQTYFDYVERFKKICLSMFEWSNLPESMNARYLEECLYYKGQAALLKDEVYGFINTQCASNGYLNIYGLPTSLNCYSYQYNSIRKLYSGLENKENEECVLVMNNWSRIPTASTIELFCQRLAEAEQTAMINIKAQKTPVLIVVDENQRLMMENLYAQYDGNRPFIFGDKNQLGADTPIKSINTGANFIADKIMEYKKQIWNEALEFLGINTLQTEKKERLITDEASSNNELINLNLQSMLIPRQQAADEFNKLFNLTGDKAISVRVRSDLFNIIKQEENSFTDLNHNNIDDKLEIGDDLNA